MTTSPGWCARTRRGAALLYCGTETGVYVSFDDGASWRRLGGNLPVVPIHDLVVAQGDLVLATHGRSFWMLDDLSLLRQLGDLPAQPELALLTPRDDGAARDGCSTSAPRRRPAATTPSPPA